MIIVEPARPAFHANKNGSNQASVVGGTYTKCTATTELYDILGFYDAGNSKWTPPAGRIIIGGKIYITGTTAAGNYSYAVIYKDGSALAHFPSACFANASLPQATVEDICDGTNYYELWGEIQLTSGTATFDGSVQLTQFYGHWIGP